MLQPRVDGRKELAWSKIALTESYTEVLGQCGECE